MAAQPWRSTTVLPSEKLRPAPAACSRGDECCEDSTVCVLLLCWLLLLPLPLVPLLLASEDSHTCSKRDGTGPSWHVLGLA